MYESWNMISRRLLGVYAVAAIALFWISVDVDLVFRALLRSNWLSNSLVDPTILSWIIALSVGLLISLATLWMRTLSEAWRVWFLALALFCLFGVIKGVFEISNPGLRAVAIPHAFRYATDLMILWELGTFVPLFCLWRWSWHRFGWNQWHETAAMVLFGISLALVLIVAAPLRTVPHLAAFSSTVIFTSLSGLCSVTIIEASGHARDWKWSSIPIAIGLAIAIGVILPGVSIPFIGFAFTMSLAQLLEAANTILQGRFGWPLSKTVTAYLAFLTTMTAFHLPMLVQNEVLAINNMRYHLGASEADDQGSYYFHWCDQVEVFVPNLRVALHSRPSGSLALWNPHSEFGRPVTHLAARSTAHPMMYALSLITDDEFEIFTWQWILLNFLCGTFMFLLLVELEIDPFAAFVGAVFLAYGLLSCFLSYYPGWSAVFAWTVCTLWLVTLFCRSGKLYALPGIAVSVSSLITMGILPIAVMHLWLISFFSAGMLWSRCDNWLLVVKRGLLLMAAGAVAIGLCSPYIADTMVARELAARMTDDRFDDHFFAGSQRDAHSACHALLTVIDPYVLDDPITMTAKYHEFDPGYTRRGIYPIPSVVLCPVYTILLVSGLTSVRMRAWWPLVILASVPFMLSWFTVTHVVLVKVLGLGLSSYPTDYVSIIPIAIVIAFGIEAILGMSFSLPRTIGIGVLLVLFACSLGYASTWMTPEVSARAACFTSLVLGSTFAMSFVPRRLLWFLLILFATLCYGWPAFKTRPEVLRETQLTQVVREISGDERRFALIRSSPDVLLSPDSHIQGGLNSIHTYNSFVTTEYVKLMQNMSVGPSNLHGRRHNYVDLKTVEYGPTFWISGVNVVVSNEQLDVLPWLEHIATIDNTHHVYRTRVEPKMWGLVESSNFRKLDTTIEWIPRDPTLPSLHALEPLDRCDDVKTFRFKADDGARLLFLSQQFHPHWYAYSGDERLEAIRVNDFFQGVIVPPGVTNVKLRFEPYSRFAVHLRYLLTLFAAMCGIGWIFDPQRQPCLSGENKSESGG